MTTMRCNPVNRSTLKGENPEHGQYILDAFWHLQATMGEQPVEAERHAEAARQINQNRRNADGAPGR